jgi:hypothetical protein
MGGSGGSMGGTGGSMGGTGGSTGGTGGANGGSGGESGGSSGCDGGVSPDAAPQGCVLTQGYWKNHPGAWPVGSLTIGGVTYSESELLDLLNTSPSGDESIVLAHQLIATLLNVAAGAVPPSDVARTIADAQAWAAANADADGRLPFGIDPETPAGHDACTYSTGCDDFNSGNNGPPHCP